jgi:hypothetical protein
VGGGGRRRATASAEPALARAAKLDHDVLAGPVAHMRGRVGARLACARSLRTDSPHWCTVMSGLRSKRRAIRRAYCGTGSKTWMRQPYLAKMSLAH